MSPNVPILSDVAALMKLRCEKNQQWYEGFSVCRLTDTSSGKTVSGDLRVGSVLISESSIGSDSNERSFHPISDNDPSWVVRRDGEVAATVGAVDCSASRVWRDSATSLLVRRAVPQIGEETLPEILEAAPPSDAGQISMLVGGPAVY